MVEQYKRDFPILSEKVHNKPLVYLDNAASAQKPRMVIEAMQRFYEKDYANIHRGVHELSVRATNKYENVRDNVRQFINAKYTDEIVFVRGATEAINLIDQSWGKTFLKAGDEIVITALEHHANIVPWQMLRQQLGIVLKVIPVTALGEVHISDVENAINTRTKLISIAHVSNVLGTILPVKDIISLAHSKNIITLIDGCQAICHMPVDVQDIDADFYVFSGHKLYGPTGIGVLYGKRSILSSMPPYQGGGDMISSVTFDETTYKEPPHRFEAGTPAIAEAIGLGAALDYLRTIGLTRIARHEANLLDYATKKLTNINSVKIVGLSEKKSGIISFVMEGIHPHDLGTILDRQGVAIRAGHHCAQPLMDHLGLTATARVSFGLYNSLQDIDSLGDALLKAREIFS
jgi:cysteine desulfurase/selenocysteine lyase